MSQAATFKKNVVFFNTQITSYYYTYLCRQKWDAWLPMLLFYPWQQKITLSSSHRIMTVLQRNWVRPQHPTGSLYGGCLQGVDWPTRLFRQRPVLGLQHRGWGTSTWAGTRRLDRDKHCFATFLFTDIFKNSYNVSQIIAKVWKKGFSTVVSSWL